MMEDDEYSYPTFFSKNVAKYALFEKLFGVSALFKYFCRIICDDTSLKSSYKNSPSVKCMDAFRSALAKEPKLLIKQKYGWDNQLSVLLSSSDIENHFFLDFENMQIKVWKIIT